MYIKDDVRKKDILVWLARDATGSHFIYFKKPYFNMTFGVFSATEYDAVRVNLFDNVDSIRCGYCKRARIKISNSSELPFKSKFYKNMNFISSFVLVPYKWINSKYFYVDKIYEK